MDDTVTTPTVLELALALEPTTRDDFGDEPSDHLRIWQHPTGADAQPHERGQER